MQGLSMSKWTQRHVIESVEHNYVCKHEYDSRNIAFKASNACDSECIKVENHCITLKACHFKKNDVETWQQVGIHSLTHKLHEYAKKVELAKKMKYSTFMNKCPLTITHFMGSQVLRTP